MEHIIDWGEYEILRETDFVVPLKQVGLITRTVLEAIQLFYRPRRIVVVTARSEAALLRLLSPFWSVGPALHIIAEEDYFKPNFGLALGDLLAEYGAPCEDERRREPGWWIQQLIKLGAGTQVPNISPVYVVWDGDLIPVRRWKLCERVRAEHLSGATSVISNSGSGGGSPTSSHASSSGDERAGGGSSSRYYIAILQAESRSAFNTAQYAECMRALCGFGPREPDGGGTFVAHHMVFHRAVVAEMLDHMVRHTGSSLPWPLLIMSYSRRYFRFSEYKTYASYVLQRMRDLRGSGVTTTEAGAGAGAEAGYLGERSKSDTACSICSEEGFGRRSPYEDFTGDGSPPSDHRAKDDVVSEGCTTPSSLLSPLVTSSSGDLLDGTGPSFAASDAAAFRYHLLDSFGSGGIRFRGGSEVVAEMIAFCGVRDGGIPYNKVREFVRLKWKSMVAEAAANKKAPQCDKTVGTNEGSSSIDSTSATNHSISSSSKSEVQLHGANANTPSCISPEAPESDGASQPDAMITDPVVPAYLQIDHIYGLADVDMNLTQPALSLPDRTRKRVDSSQSSRFTLDLVVSGMMEQNNALE